jgi:pimeloyl-ACP methyl ester carboxylesterase
MKRFERLRPKKVDYSHRLGERTVLWSMHEAEDIQIDEVVLVVPGIMAKRSLYDPYAQAMAEKGMAVATMAHQGASPLCSKEVSLVASELAQRYQRPVRLIAHSLGGIHATLAAHDSPEDISGVLLQQPAGYGGVHPTHAVMSLLDRPDNAHLRHEIHAVYDGLDYFKSSRVDHLIRTVVMASRYEAINKGSELAEHIKKSALLFPDDKLIHTEKCKNGLSRAGFAWLDLDLTVWQQSTGGEHKYYPAGHNAPMYYPEAVADATISIVDGTSFGIAA